MVVGFKDNEDGSVERSVREGRIRKVRSHRFSATKAVGVLAKVMDVGLKMMMHAAARARRKKKG